MSQILYGAWTTSANYLCDRVLEREPPSNEPGRAVLYACIAALWARSACMQAELAFKASPLHRMPPVLGILRWTINLTPLITLIGAQKTERLRHRVDFPEVVGKASDCVIVAASCYLCLIREHRLMAVSTLAFRSIYFACNCASLSEEWKTRLDITHFCVATLGCLFLGNTIHKICGVVIGVFLFASSFFPLEPTETTDSKIASLAKLMKVEPPGPELPLRERYEQLKNHANKSFSLTHHPDKTAEPEKQEKFKRAQQLLGQLKSLVESQTLSPAERVRNLTHAVIDLQTALKEKRESIIGWENQIAETGTLPNEEELTEMESLVEELSQLL